MLWRGDEEKVPKIVAGRAPLHAAYGRHVDRVTGFGSWRFPSPEEVADFTHDGFGAAAVRMRRLFGDPFDGPAA